MSVRILYEEGAREQSIKDSVYVQLRIWGDNDERVGCDAVLEMFVKIDGNPKTSYQIMNGYSKTDAEFIRFTIAKFDELVKRHPHPSFVNRENPT